MASSRAQRATPRALVIDIGATADLDVATTDMLAALFTRTPASSGIELRLAQVRGSVRDRMRRTGLMTTIGEEPLYLSVEARSADPLPPRDARPRPPGCVVADDAGGAAAGRASAIAGVRAYAELRRSRSRSPLARWPRPRPRRHPTTASSSGHDVRRRRRPTRPPDATRPGWCHSDDMVGTAVGGTSAPSHRPATRPPRWAALSIAPPDAKPNTMLMTMRTQQLAARCPRLSPVDRVVDPPGGQQDPEEPEDRARRADRRQRRQPNAKLAVEPAAAQTR